MSLEQWSDYIGVNWLKAEDVKDENIAFAIIAIDETEEDQRPLLSLEREKVEYKFTLNVTNAQKCAQFVDTPKKLVGKKVYFKKVMVTNPATKKEVESLRIYNLI